MESPALGAIGFVLGTILNLYAMVVALRVVMQAVRADYYNPLAQFVVKATDPLLLPLRRVLPSGGRIDVAAVLLCIGVLFGKLVLFKLASLGFVPAFGRSLNPASLPALALVLASLIDFVHLMFNIFIFAIFIQAILSWIPGAQGNPVQGLLYSITEPVLQPVRRYMPATGGLDLSALVAIIGLYALRIFVVGTLINLLLA